jgi:hypothetical protein
MEDTLPGPAEHGRAGPRRNPSERLSTIVNHEIGAAKADSKNPQPIAKATLDQRMASLALALRRARVESAEKSASVADLRAAEIGRLEILADALAPIIDQTPKDCDIFDLAISPGERPRLFIDQIGFIEMDRDQRTYRFLQDTRHGRILLCESDSLDDVVDSATDYIAHRLIEREKALAVDYASGGALRSLRVRKAETGRPAPRGEATWPASAFRDKAFQAFLFVVEFLGSAAFFGLLAIILLWAYRTYVAS